MKYGMDKVVMNVRKEEIYVLLFIDDLSSWGQFHKMSEQHRIQAKH